jgi:YVTN family beta-propeller protein
MSNSLSVINTDSMKAMQTISTGNKPIGVTCDAGTGNVWVACYSGSIQIFKNVPTKKETAVVPVVSKQPKKVAPIAAALTKQPEKPTDDEFNYHVVVGAFKEESNLKKMIAKCKKAGYKPYVINPDDNLKKLSCAGFEDKETALQALENIKTKFGDGVWVCKHSQP